MLRSALAGPGTGVSRKSFLSACLLFAASFLFPASAAAQCVWTGAVGNGWGIAGNWNNCGGVAPVNGSHLLFPDGAFNPANVNNLAGLEIGSIQVNGTGAGNVPYTITGNAIELDGPLNMNVPAIGGQSFLVPIVLGQNLTILVFGPGTATVGAIDLGTFTLSTGSNVAAATLRMEGVVSGTGALSKFGPGTLWLTAANTFNGPFDINATAVQVTNAGAFGASGAGNGTVVHDGAEVLINVGANTVFAESFTLSGEGFANVGAVRADTPTFTISGPISTPTVAAIGVPLDHVLTFSGTVSGAGLRKLSGGTLILTGANTHGNALVLGGSLFVNGNQPASSVDVMAGLLGGIGATGQVTATGGTIAPGLSPGIITTGNLNLNGATTLLVEMDGPAVGTGYDQTNVVGSVTLGNPTLDIDLTFAPAEGAAFIIINNDGGDAVVGEFAGLAQGAIVNLDGQPFHVNYQGGDGNDVVLIFAPNGVPTMPVLMFIGLAVFLAALVTRRLQRSLIRA